LNEEPRFVEQDDADAELKWVIARLERKEKERKGLATMIEPDGDDFWKGTNPRVDTKPKSLTKEEIDEIWAKRQGVVEETQRRYVRRLEAQKRRDEEAKQREEDAEIAASNKRKAEGFIEPATKKARDDREGRITKTIKDALASWLRKQHVAAEAHDQEKQRVQRLIDNANVARVVKDSTDPGATYAGVKRKFDDDAENMLMEEEIARQQANKKRAAQNKPPLPPRSEWEFRQKYSSPVIPMPANITLNIDDMIKKAAVKLAEKQQQEKTLAASQPAIQDLRDISTATIRDWLLVTRNSHIPTQARAKPTPAQITQEQRQFDAKYKKKAFTRREERAIEEHKKSGSKIPESYVRQRLEDLDEWRRIFDETSRKFISDIDDRHQQGEFFSAEQYAETLGVDSAEDLRLDRKALMIRKHYGHGHRDNLLESDVPWRPINQQDPLLGKFHDMLLDLRDWDTAVKWITDSIKQGILPRVEGQDGTFSAVI
jgi:hypothetical protein